MIERTSTPTEYFRFNGDPAAFAEILVTYSQGDEVVLTKHKSDLVIDGLTASFTFTQEETKLFDPSLLLATQVRVAWDNGLSFPSQIVYRRVQDVLDDRILPEE